MDNPIAAIALGAMWVFFLLTWTIPSFRRNEPHEVLESLGLGAFITLVILVYGGVWKTTSSRAGTIASIPLQLLALVLVIGSFHALKTKGKPTDSWEQTTVVVKGGVYRVARHPMYLGTGLWAISIAVSRQGTNTALLSGAVALLTFLAGITEDRYNVRKFGQPYVDYMKTVPLLWRFGARHHRSDSA